MWVFAELFLEIGWGYQVWTDAWEVFVKEFYEFLGGVFGYGCEVAGGGEESAGERFVEGGYCDEHEGASGPDVQVVGVNGEERI